MNKRTRAKEAQEPYKILLCGAALSGNMGGPALYISIVDSLEKRLGQVDISILSKYPRADLAASTELQWQLIPFPTSTQLFLGVPFSLLCSLFRVSGLPVPWIARGPFRAYHEHDLLIDLSGISFTDDRTLSGLLINSLWLMPAVAMGKPWMKASQAMGPFTKPWTYWTSRFFLARAEALVARGQKSAQFVRELLPQRTIYELPDVAFVLPPASQNEVDQTLSNAGIDVQRPFCVVGPSFVVNMKVSKSDGPETYSKLMATVADELVTLTGEQVLLVPHARASAVSPLDDLDVCENTLQFCQSSTNVRVLRDHVSATILKGIIARAEVAVGSRFHFMVAAMSSGVPGLAVAWSHKYLEMMQMVGQDRFAIQHDSLTPEALVPYVRELWSERAKIRAEIGEYLPEVKRQAEQNAEIAIEILKRI